MAHLNRYIDFILRRRWWVIAFTTLLMILAAVGGDRLVVADDFRQLLGRNNPQLAALNQLEDTYAASNTVLIAVSVRKGSVFTAPHARRDRGVDRGRMEDAAFQPCRLPYELQLHPCGGR